jgi:two-component system phosphate regulon sensor histidine kinase PhoR
MFIFLTLFFFVLSLALGYYMLRTRRLVAGLTASLHVKRRYLPEVGAAVLRRHGIKDLVDLANELTEAYQRHAEQSAGYSKQVEVMLCAVQELVVIFNAERVVEFANKSAERILRGGRSLKGVRLESVLRSLSLLELLDRNSEADSETGLKQISLEYEGNTLWFEASCGQVRGIAAPRALSSLLVLHDITKLKHLEVMRRDFVANVSHELRTPLTIIKGFAEALADDVDRMPVQARDRFIGKIVKNAERLHVLVEDLMTLSRLESNPGKLKPEVHNLRSLLEDILDDYRPRLKESGQVIELDCDDELESFAFDRFRVHQVWDNLLVNVFRYAPDFSRLQLRAKYNAAAGCVVCCVQDDGPGIPPADLLHIFERFYRVEKGRSSERGGTGLGLSIVKHIVQLHGGSITAESKLGQGTTVQFTLPYRQSFIEHVVTA